MVGGGRGRESSSLVTNQGAPSLGSHRGLCQAAFEEANEWN